MFGAGGGTSAYVEAEDADLLVLWGSNARETHPIFFHHVLQGLKKGTRMWSVDPRRTSTAQWADGWLGLDVGTDIALANAIGREIIHAGLVNEPFVRRATTGFDEYRATVEPYTLERAQEITGVDAELIRELAHAYATADRAQICWTLGITEHHNAADYVFALINLALLTGHVGRYGSGLVPLRGQNNVQGGGDMGAIPAKLPGGYDLGDDEARGRYEQAWGVSIPPKPGMHLSQMFDAMNEGTLKALYCIGENPAESEANATHARHLLEGLDHLVVQDIFRTATADLADVVLPAAADWCEYEGTVTNSERRVQRVRKAIDPPGQARPGHPHHLRDRRAARPRVGRADRRRGVGRAALAVAELAPRHVLRAAGRARRPAVAVPDRGPPRHPAAARAAVGAGPGRAGRARAVHAGRARAAGRHAHRRVPDPAHHRPACSTPTTPASRPAATPRRCGGGSRCAWTPTDGEKLGIADGERVRVVSRRGAVEAPVAFDPSLRPGLASFTPHFSEEVDINVLTNDAWDPKSGTSEFKATAIRVEKIAEAMPAAGS